MNGSKLDVVIADDHALVRQGLRMLIDCQSDMTVVGEAGDGHEALTMIQQLRPAVAVVDVSMPVMNGIELTARLAGDATPTKVLALTANEDRGYMHRLFSSGVCGYLLKRSAADELIRAIRSVSQGIRYLDPSILDELVGMTEFDKSTQQKPEVALSERETEVLKLIAQGLTNKEIAARLDISVKTVETYKARSMQKLGLRGRADIVRFAVDRSWLRDI
ncbi:response regulator [Schlesneria sp. T3-172]|uniref:response regulator transcription factor n=1 Tax=Schlesneria TaxID=656899 RepID=UPI002F0BE915